MNVLLIEDEELASERLKRLLNETDPSLHIAGMTDSIESSVAWLLANPAPDLIFADIQLADGSSFEIFNKVHVKSPVIFTTAYDQYAIDAFKFNSIGYVLKPIKKTELEQALQKFRQLQQATPATPVIDYQALANALGNRAAEYQKRLVIKFGQTIRTIEISEIAYFYTEEKITFAVTKEGKKWPLDHTLDELEMMLDPAQFFRINRQFIVLI